MNEDIKKRLVLKDGESVESKGSRTKGFMGETDIYSYEIVDASGKVVGSAEHTHHTAVKGFKVTETLTQKDSNGNIIVDERW